MNNLSPIPDFIEPVIGFRVWKLLDGKLYSPLQSHRWAPGTNKARCRRGGMAPSCHATCGLYAQYHIDGISSALRAVGVIGAIQAWGTLEAHPTGFRAEYARPILLACSPYANTRQLRRIKQAATDYRLEVVAESELEERSYTYGARLDVKSALYSW